MGKWLRFILAAALIYAVGWVIWTKVIPGVRHKIG